MTLLKIFLAGWGILTAAIVINLIASRLGIDSWWTLLAQAGKVGFFKALQAENIVSLVFLLIVYPGLLGLTAYLILKFH